jgi:hypothetical protein
VPTGTGRGERCRLEADGLALADDAAVGIDALAQPGQLIHSGRRHLCDGGGDQRLEGHLRQDLFDRHTGRGGDEAHAVRLVVEVEQRHGG